ncbi:PIN domain-containing protein [Enterococcus lemanii]|uniref:PIN domain-containing protein n=1 Tax=Enterococcus lemanii TaxID=1159752 RepID=A0ABV9MWB1_9ENTE|nr:putative nucleic acid-binding protein [Enterococcus lemanii]
MSEGLKTFIDANILFYMNDFRKYAVDEWLEQLYDTIYIHKEVLEELKLENVKKFYQDKLENSRKWELFNPEDEDCLTEDQYDIYMEIFNQIRIQFKEFQEEREEKNTTDSGDIAILAGCQLLEIPLITSQDSDFEKVIDKYDLKISHGIEELPDESIKVHDILKLGNQLIERNICTRSQYKKFCKASIGVEIFSKIEKYLVDNNS